MKDDEYVVRVHKKWHTNKRFHKRSENLCRTIIKFMERTRIPHICVIYARTYKRLMKNDYPERWITWLVGRWRTQLIARQLVNCRTHEHRHFERTLRSSDTRSWITPGWGSYQFQRLLGFAQAAKRRSALDVNVFILTCKRDVLKCESSANLNVLHKFVHIVHNVSCLKRQKFL